MYFSKLFSSHFVTPLIKLRKGTICSFIPFQHIQDCEQTLNNVHLLRDKCTLQFNAGVEGIHLQLSFSSVKFTMMEKISFLGHFALEQKLVKHSSLLNNHSAESYQKLLPVVFRIYTVMLLGPK